MTGRLLDPLADPGGVDETPGATAQLDQLVDRVNGGAGDVVDDDPLGAGQLVEHRGLADVGPADDRDPARAADLGLLLGRWLGQGVQDGVEHVPRAAPVQRRDRDRLSQPEVPQAVRLGLGALVVDLVGGQHDRLARLAQDLDDRFVDVGDPDGRVDDEQHRVGERDRDLGLAGDPLGQSPGIGVPAAGVDDGEGATVPDRVVGDPVTRHARHVLDDRLAAPDDPVDQRRLADVGAADDSEHRHRLGCRRSSRRRTRSCLDACVGVGVLVLGPRDGTGEGAAGELLGLLEVGDACGPAACARPLRPRSLVRGQGMASNV